MPPRPIRPKDEPGANEGSDSALEVKGGKRRAVSSACIPCRKRKSKCDGALPSCSTCTAVYRTVCSYDVDSDHRRKGALKRDLQSLQQQNDALDVIVASLRSLPEPEAIALLHNLRSDTSPEMLAASLRNEVRLPQSFAQETLEADFAEQMSEALNSAKIEDTGWSSSNDYSSERVSDAVSPTDTPATWFRTPQDAEFIEHLLSLYFSWVHPFYRFFSRECFMHDMGRGKSDFCSAILVNALLSMACHYSDRLAARTNPNDSQTAGDQYFAEAKRILDNSEKPSLTTVQALGIMSIRETSHGRDSNGYQYAGRCVRMALELGLHLSVIGNGTRPAENEVRKITFWGVFNLETLCCIGVGRVSQLPRAVTDIPKPTPVDRLESQSWRPYVDANLAISPSAEQPARTTLFMGQISKLSEIASDMIDKFYAPHERFTSRRLAAVYAQYQEWYQNLPEVFRLENTTLPHVIILHMYYYGCILHLFRPYIKLDLRGSNIFPRDACTFCANQISALTNALRAMYGLRRVPLAITHLLLSASTIHLLNLPAEPAATNLSQAMHDLQAMSVNHQFAARCIEIVRALASKWNIALPEAAATVATLLPSTAWPSPPSSSFWAASIPRKHSSARSGSSTSGHHESPFRPPVQSQANLTPFYNDPMNPQNTGQTQNQFWTPFPTQTIPLQSQNIVPSMSMDFSPVENQIPNWTDIDRSGGAHLPQQQASIPQHPIVTMGESMTIEDWHWQ